MQFGSGYTYYPTLKTLSELLIKLPTIAGEIDFDFMENFISAIQKLVIKDVVIFAEEKMNAYRQVVQK